MPLVITPDEGIPLPLDATPEDLKDFREKAHALFNTVQELVTNGLDIEITDQDHKAAAQMLATEEVPTNKTVKAGSIIVLENILSEYDKEILDVTRRLRTFVTNKLLLETEDQDPKIRLKALELLGKISSVGLFSNNIDITVTHRSVADIERELMRVLDTTGMTLDVTPETKTLAAIDLDEELGRNNADA